MKTDSTTELIELFSSLQGEGQYLGYRQIFLRLPGCNLQCGYCDTVLQAPEACRVETEPGSGIFRDLPQPVALSQVCDLAEAWCSGLPGAHHSFSITGGEPLLHGELLAVWLPRLREILPVHLETNGSLSDALPPLLSLIDHISMDIKLPSVTGMPPLWEQHRRFLELAVEADLAVKVVAGEATTDQDLLMACGLVSEVDDGIPLIIQPVTGPEGRVAVAPARLLHWQALAASLVREVRVIPQTHRMLGVP